MFYASCWAFCSILCTCTSCDPSVIRISGWIVLVNQLDWVRVLWSSTFRIVLKPKNASPRSLVHRLSKRQQLQQLHLNLHHSLDDLPGLTGRTDTPDSWRTVTTLSRSPVEDDWGGDPSDETVLWSESVDSAQSKVKGPTHWMARVIAICSSI